MSLAAGSSEPHDTRPTHARLRNLLLVFAGGAVGTGARLALLIAFPWIGSGLPWAIVGANFGGAFLLGVLLGALERQAPETPARRDLRLCVGTGVMGGFTTYSSFATDAVLIVPASGWLALTYGFAMLVAGLSSGFLGLRVGAGRLRTAAPEAAA